MIETFSHRNVLNAPRTACGRALRTGSFCAVWALLVQACASPSHEQCLADAVSAPLPAHLDEASGIAASRRTDDILWAHNDSEGTATLYALDRSGRLLAEIALPDAITQFDWEDIAAGPCPAGDCLYIGDIGDNLHDRDDRAIIRITEPFIDTDTLSIERFPFSYPDGPEDAEAIFVMPDTSIYIITKGRSRAATVYRMPAPLRDGRAAVLERLQELGAGIAQLPDLVTGADAAADGGHVVVRTYSAITSYRFDSDSLIATGTIDIDALGEPQGEGIALTKDGMVLVTEAGPAGAQSFLTTLGCRVR